MGIINFIFVKRMRMGKSPNYLDWENVKTFVKFLSIFYKATLRFSGSLFVTSNTYFHELIV